ncbi:M61 family metallopeptidase [Sphingobacterium daejeonense]|uniref:M61 family metallopeptidase n=1 Tax=Sphingobacterium daejeonense TaxID=371142 RepID=UPI0010C56310|nr:PDZ domain-containing protein [Sphingobacterium daejeonense]VTP93633.1 Predicted protease with the C-terminal PDZ domain [Sphingobacterium daejeonense]
MSNSSIHFHLSFIEPQAHYVEVSMVIQGFDQDFLDLKMPVWTPGSYLIREFSKNLEQVQAQDENGNDIEIQKINKNTWRVNSKGQETKINYRVYSFEKSVRTNFVDDQHAFISPAGTFFYIDGYLDHASTVQVSLPPFWSKISTGLDLIEGKVNLFFAENFDILYDTPLEIGNQDTWTFNAAGIPHEFAMVGTANYDKDRLSADIKKIVEVETEIWGSNPNDKYVFITHNYLSSHGGLEHLNSTVLAASRSAYQSNIGYNNFLSLVAHEYFHLWNVKRLRPANLGPFNYEEENYTSLLWIFEGFTAYYDNIITRRCGFRNEQEYLNELVSEFNLVLNRAGRNVQSVGLSSFDTWIKQYRPDENSPNVSISYYNKGAMLATMMDILIIAKTNGTKRLDDVLKAAYNKYYLIENRGITEKEFQDLAEEVSGISLKEIFDAVYVTEDLDYNAYFNLVGYQFIDINRETETPSLGIKVSHHDGRTVIKNVDRNSAAWVDGLNVDDEIIAVNGNRLDPQGRELDQAIATSSLGDPLNILVARDGLMREITVHLKASDKVSYVIERNPESTDQQRRLGDIWLSLS